MTCPHPSPWSVLVGPVEPPPWQGPAHVFRLMSDGDAQPEETPPPPPPERARVCTQCEEEFPLTTEFFHAHKRKRGGFRTVCKRCVNEERPSRAKASPVWWTDANEQPKGPPMTSTPCAVPLVEQLRSIPRDAVLRIDTPNALGCMDTCSIPVGRLCYEAAAALQQQEEPREVDAEHVMRWCQSLVAALKRLSFAAQTTGGTAGPDAELQAAIAQAEAAMSLRAMLAASPSPQDFTLPMLEEGK